MFSEIECPEPAYRRMQTSGLRERIKDKKEDIHSFFLFNGIDKEGNGEEVINFAKRNIGMSGELGIVYREIVNLADELDENEVRLDEFEEAMVQNPCFLGYFVLGKEIIHPEKFGFPSRRKLEEAIASFCIGEDHLFSDYGHQRIWRNRGLKNGIFLNEHGDLYASQKDVSGCERIVNTLFGAVEEFDCIKRAEETSAIYSYQDWSGFLISLLRYAEYVGKKNIPEIVNWRGVLDVEGAVGTNTAECMFGGGDDWGIKFMLETPVLTPGIKPEIFPWQLPCRDLTIFPYLCDKRLVFMTQTKGKNEGEVIKEFEGTHHENSRFVRGIVYDERDLVEALRATYKYFARDRTLLPKIMDLFLKE